MESRPQNPKFRINPENFHPRVMDESFQNFEADFLWLKMLN